MASTETSAGTTRGDTHATLPIAEIDIADRCNLRCKHCSFFRQGPSKSVISDETVVEELTALRDRHGIQVMTFTGGEPLLKSELLAKLTPLFRVSRIFTNGTQSLLPFDGVQNVHYYVSLDGPPDLNDSLRGKGIFEKTARHLGELRHNGVTFAHTISSRNIDRLEDSVECLRSMKASVPTRVAFSFFTPLTRYRPIAGFKHFDQTALAIPTDQRDAVVDRISALSQRYGDFIANPAATLDYFRTRYAVSERPCPLRDHGLCLDYNLKRKLPCTFGSEVDCAQCGSEIQAAFAARLDGHQFASEIFDGLGAFWSVPDEKDASLASQASHAEPTSHAAPREDAPNQPIPEETWVESSEPTDSTSPGVSWPRVLLRVIRLVATLVVAASWYLGRRIALGLIRNPTHRQNAVAKLQGQSLRWTFSHLGATFIKLGQVMSSRPDLFDPTLIDELRQLQDKLPPFGFRRARRIIEQDLGGRLEKHFREFNPRPLAAASVAQVHQAMLHDGTEVAVKVLRPGIREQVTRDAVLLQAAARLLSIHPAARAAGVANHANDFLRAIILQTDLALEAANYGQFRANFQGFKGVVFPRVFSSVSSGRVLTMDLLRGTKVDEIRVAQYPGIDERLTRMAFKMLFEDGFVHADLHPGNLFVTDSGEIAVLDVGLVKRLDDKELDFFLDFSRCLTMGSGADVGRHLRRYYKYSGPVDWKAVEREGGALVGQFRGKRLRDTEIRDVLRHMFAFGRRYGFRPPSNKVLIMVAIVTVEGLRRKINPNLDSFKAMSTFLRPILQRRGMMGPNAPSARQCEVTPSSPASSAQFS